MTAAERPEVQGGQSTARHDDLNAKDQPGHTSTVSCPRTSVVSQTRFPLAGTEDRVIDVHRHSVRRLDNGNWSLPIHAPVATPGTPAPEDPLVKRGAIEPTPWIHLRQANASATAAMWDSNAAMVRTGLDPRRVRMFGGGPARSGGSCWASSPGAQFHQPVVEQVVASGARPGVTPCPLPTSTSDSALAFLASRRLPRNTRLTCRRLPVRGCLWCPPDDARCQPVPPKMLDECWMTESSGRFDGHICRADPKPSQGASPWRSAPQGHGLDASGVDGVDEGTGRGAGRSDGRQVDEEAPGHLVPRKPLVVRQKQRTACALTAACSAGR